MTELINEFDRIIRWPKKYNDKKRILEWLSNKFKQRKNYSENDVNKIIEKYHAFNDVALLRRELISRKLLCRKNDGTQYWKIN